MRNLILPALLAALSPTVFAAAVVLERGPGDPLAEVNVVRGLDFEQLEVRGCDMAGCQIFGEAAESDRALIPGLISTGLEFELTPLRGSFTSVSFATAVYATAGVRDPVTIVPGRQGFSIKVYDVDSGALLGSTSSDQPGLGIRSVQYDGAHGAAGLRFVVDYEFEAGLYKSASCDECSPTPGAAYRYITSLTVNQAAPVPEPSTYALMALGLAGIGIAMRRRAVN